MDAVTEVECVSVNMHPIQWTYSHLVEVSVSATLVNMYQVDVAKPKVGLTYFRSSWCNWP